MHSVYISVCCMRLNLHGRKYETHSFFQGDDVQVAVDVAFSICQKKQQESLKQQHLLQEEFRAQV